MMDGWNVGRQLLVLGPVYFEMENYIQGRDNRGSFRMMAITLWAARFWRETARTRRWWNPVIISVGQDFIENRKGLVEHTHVSKGVHFHVDQYGWNLDKQYKKSRKKKNKERNFRTQITTDVSFFLGRPFFLTIIINHIEDHCLSHRHDQVCYALEQFRVMNCSVRAGLDAHDGRKQAMTKVHSFIG